MQKISQDIDREFRFTVADLNTLAAMVRQMSGIVLTERKYDMVYARLAKRLRALGLTDFKSYLEFLKTAEGEGEIPVLINAMTTNLTKFFRETHHFDHLGAKALPESLALQKAGKQSRLRIWSSACSSGEEAYSIAMTCRRLVVRPKDVDLKILATDLDTNMLERARQGVYDGSDASLIPEHAHKWLEKRKNTTQNGQIRMSEGLRQMIAFKQLNLMHEWPMKGPFDVIFCRNVLIYFDGETKSNLVRRMAGLLRPGGYLYLGHSESVMGIDDIFEFQGQTVYQRKGGEA